MKYPSRSMLLEAALLLGLATVFYGYAFGFATLAPSHVGYLMNGDAAQHYLGFEFFRHDAWRWPLGGIHTYFFPQGLSVVYTDSIPWLAIVAKAGLKLFGNAGLPFSSFQYTGMWLGLCLLGQLSAGYLLARTAELSRGLSFLVAVVLMTCPISIYRSGGHFALVGMFIPMLALWLFLRQFTGKAFCTAGWLVVLALGVGTHFYLLAMSAPFFACAWLKAVLDERPRRRLVVLSPVLACALLVGLMYVFGYFVIGFDSAKAEGYGEHALNLNFLWNTSGLSKILPNPPVAMRSQEFETYNYMGFGALLALPFSLYFFWRKKLTSPLFWLPFAVLFLLALTNVVTFNDKILFRVDLPLWLTEKLAIFRASARLMWPATVFLMFSGLAGLCMLLGRASQLVAAAVVAALLVVQIYDLRPMHEFTLGSCAKPVPAEVLVHDETVNALAAKSKLVVLFPFEPHQPKMQAPALLALRHGLSINAGLFARLNLLRFHQFWGVIAFAFNHGQLLPKTLYVGQASDGPEMEKRSGLTPMYADGLAILHEDMPGLAAKP